MAQLIVKSSYTLASKKASETIAKQCDCIKPTKKAKEHFNRKPYYFTMKEIGYVL